jgi:hypothetical protein
VSTLHYNEFTLGPMAQATLVLSKIAKWWRHYFCLWHGLGLSTVVGAWWSSLCSLALPTRARILCLNSL